MNERVQVQEEKPSTSRFAYFRQSGWMLVATVVGGAFMWAVHPILQKPVDQVDLGALTHLLKRFVSAPISKDDYGLFGALVGLLGLMGIPAVGLQTIFAHQTASAITESLEQQLRTTARTVLAVGFLIWLALCLTAFFFRRYLMGTLEISQAASLWITLLTGLLVLWTPVLTGILQGRQNFLWYGWTSISGGIGRCLAIAIIVRVLGHQVTGTMLGVLVGVSIPFLICLSQTYRVLRGPGAAVPWSGWLKRVCL